MTDTLDLSCQMAEAMRKVDPEDRSLALIHLLIEEPALVHSYVQDLAGAMWGTAENTHSIHRDEEESDESRYYYRLTMAEEAAAKALEAAAQALQAVMDVPLDDEVGS